ncbi:type II toxin-antitoxin system Phd/YefM family antitoxin [Humibacter sp. RRB41]|uniref:type II toxin-antitoxin system Phd/YefM family antitoxin n=1 Tax=Humibacter sp. RRB41 TaxID=2919946 RepID=UPI001FAB26B3|nr:type II toxin-antitoxin system prevent-host-death family antitoxin [Humibacter sp. RRB41]
MADQSNIFDARNNLSKLVSAAQQGTDTVIARRGRPVARITRVDAHDEHSAAGLVDWIAEHPIASSAARPASELDDQVRAEREGWE